VGLLGTVGLLDLSAPNCTLVYRVGNTHAKLNGDREEVNADLLLDLLTAGNTGEINVAWLDEALGTLDGLEELLSESREVNS